MIEQIFPDLYRIEIPLPRNPLKAINAYVIKSPERNLIIDTGWNKEECMNVMQAGLRELDVDLKKTEFFITHLHADHIGLVSSLTTENSTIYFNQAESKRIGILGYWEGFLDFARTHGFPEHDLEKALSNHPALKFGPDRELTFTYLGENDTLKIGEYRFIVTETPGHTWNHLCLYEPDKKILVAGDHILNDITPNIQLWSNEMNPLKQYLASLDKIYEYDIELVLPGHRGTFRNCRERIQELKDHHRKRLDEVLSILKEGVKNAYQVASYMTWDIISEDGTWEGFPVPQKWFAMGEAMAHLKYHEEEGLIQRETDGENVRFSLK
jgi:glyoxylase-like metal-dependent hydrolase (beta-lactamase superfamily II)